jgi:LytTr DNA-binding domain
MRLLLYKEGINNFSELKKSNIDQWSKQFFTNYENSMKVFTVNQMLVVAEKISYLELKLDKNKFLRIHKSHIVATKFIREVKANEILIGNEISIGNHYKVAFLDWFDKIKT